MLSFSKVANFAAASAEFGRRISEKLAASKSEVSQLNLLLPYYVVLSLILFELSIYCFRDTPKYKRFLKETKIALRYFSSRSVVGPCSLESFQPF